MSEQFGGIFGGQSQPRIVHSEGAEQCFAEQLWQWLFCGEFDDVLEQCEAHAAVADGGSGLEGGILGGCCGGEVGDAGVCGTELFIFRQHVRESGGVCEEVSEGDGAEWSAAEIRAEGSQVFVEPESAGSGQLYGEQ